MTSEEIKETVKMIDVLERYGIRMDRKRFIRCPFHNEKTPSMKIYEDSFHCFGCGSSGDVFKFVSLYENISFKDAFLELGGTYEHEDKHERAKRMAMERNGHKTAESNDAFIRALSESIKTMKKGSDDWLEYKMMLARER